MSTGESGIDLFLQTWAAEFTLGLAGLISEYPTIHCSRARHLAAVDLQGILWWRSTIQGHHPFSIWIGTREKTWAKAGKLNWVRLLERAQSATIASINGELKDPLRQVDAQLVHASPDVQSLLYAVAGIRLARTELPALLFAIDPIAQGEIALKNPSIVPSSGIERLLDLELPLSVALGRAKLPIGEILKITSGSVLQLNGYTGAEVEIVVHGTVVAKGQVISTKGSYGVRITSIISQVDRAQLYSGL